MIWGLLYLGGYYAKMTDGRYLKNAEKDMVDITGRMLRMACSIAQYLFFLLFLLILPFPFHRVGIWKGHIRGVAQLTRTLC